MGEADCNFRIIRKISLNSIELEVWLRTTILTHYFAVDGIVAGNNGKIN